MRRTVSTIATAALCVTATVAIGSSASAATPALRFHGAQYDSPGADTRSAASLNAEWVSLINSGSRAVNLRGYTIRDRSRHVYTFGNVSIAGNGGRLWLRTGTGADSAQNRYWRSGAYIWNNDGDAASLRNAAGAAVDTCSWGYQKNRAWIAC